MEKSKISHGNGENYAFGIPLQNALGIENWPHNVQDECRRVAGQGRQFIPFEDFMVAGLDGKPLFNAWDLVMDKDITDQRNGAIHAALNNAFEPGDGAADEFLAADEDLPGQSGYLFIDDSGAELNQYADEADADESYLRVSFHGINRQSLAVRVKEKIFYHQRQKMNAKRRFCRYVRRDKTIRTAYLDSLVSRAELIAFIADAEMAVRFEQRIAAL